MPSAIAQVSVPGSRSNRATASDDQQERRPSELERLERAVLALIEQQEALRDESDELRSELTARDTTVHGLEERLLAETQCRQDAVKRIDALVGLIEQIDPGLGAAAATAASGGPSSEAKRS